MSRLEQTRTNGPALKRTPSDAEQRYRLFVETVLHGIQECDTDGVITFSNPAYAKMLGYENGELVGKRIWELLDDESEQDELRKYLSLLVSEQPPPTPYIGRSRTKDGRVIDTQVDWTYKRDEQGNVTGFISAITDITELKRSQNKLRESEERFQTFANSVGVVLWITSSDYSEMRFVSTAYERIWGRSCESLYANPKQWAESIHPDDRERVFAALAADAEKGLFEEEYRVVRPNGSIRWVRDRVFPVTDDKNRLISIAGIAEDITQSKLAESIRQNEKRLRDILDGLFGFVGVYTTDGILIEANRAPLEAAGLKKEDVIGQPFWETYWWSYSPEVQDQLREALRRAANGEIVRYDVPVRVADDRFIEIDVVFSPLLDSDGNVSQLLGFAVDITDRKRAEVALQESEERLNLAVRGTSDGLWDAELTTEKEYWSPRFKEMLGYREDEIEATFEQFQELLHPDDKVAVLEAIRLHLEEEQTYDHEFRMKTKSGEYRWFQSRGEALIDEDGKPYRMAGSIRDITDRKLIEQELLESERFLSQAEAMTKIGHWRLNPETSEIVGSDELFHIFGLTRDEASLESFLEVVHPGDREYDLHHIQRGMDHGESWDIEHRLLHQDGTVAVVHAIGEATVDESGKTVLLVGTIQDITARKQLENEVQQHQERLAHVTRLSTMGEMATGLAHELNQPLTAIATYCYAGQQDLAEAEPADQQQLRELFEKLSGQAMRAGEIIRRLRALARIIHELGISRAPESI